jgi:hypothetical protein
MAPICSMNSVYHRSVMNHQSGGRATLTINGHRRGCRVHLEAMVAAGTPVPWLGAVECKVECGVVLRENVALLIAEFCNVPIDAGAWGRTLVGFGRH